MIYQSSITPPVLPEKLVAWMNRVNTNPAFNQKILRSFGIETPTKNISSSVDITVEVWFNEGRVICVDYISIDRELMDYGHGPDVDHMGCVVQIGSQSSPLYQNSVWKILPLLAKVKYTGPISLSCYVNDADIFGKHLIIGFHPFATPVLFEMYKGDWNTLIPTVFSGVQEAMEFKSQLGIGIDLSLLPFPIDACECFVRERQELSGFNRQNLKHFWAANVQELRGRFYTTGGRLGMVTARGDDIQGFSPLRDARRRALRTISNLNIPGLIYRKDIGAKYDKDISQLRNWGMI
jgi:hypothetical protein